jgi:peptide/nickel transport system permease protein
MKRWLTQIRMLPGWSSSLSGRLSWLFLFVIAFLAVFGPWISNEKPYYCKLDGKTYFPLFSNVSESGLSVSHPSYSPVNWNTTAFESVWRTPIPYSHHTIDLKTGGYLSPFALQSVSSRFRHWLGTDALGRDVLAGMIRGCRVSLLIGLGSMLLALLIGIPLGSAGAYWGNRDWRISWFQMIMGILFSLILFLLWFTPLSISLKSGASLVFFGIGLMILLRFGNQGHGTISIPVDRLVMGWISIIDGFPGLFLILILVAIVPLKGWVVVMMTIALLRWPSMARYMRAEVFKMKETNYIKAAQILNIPSWEILRKHIIPFAFRPVMISFIFGVSSAILAESSLSFLGIGLPPEEVNWGRLLAQSRNHFEAWWLVVLPGSAIFFTLLSLYTIGNAWQKEKVEIQFEK